MAITLTPPNPAVAADAAWGNVIATLSVSGAKLQSNPWGYFGISGNELRVAWQGVVATPGVYTVQLHAPGGPPVSFDITITPAAKVLPTPKSLGLTPASAAAPDTSAAGLALSTAAVTMSDGSAFSGQLVTPNTTMVKMSGPRVVLNRALTAADDGTHKVVVSATQNGASVTASLSLTVTATAPAPPPPSIQVNGASGPVSVTAGAAITGTVANGPGNATDWLGVYAVGAASGPSDPASWKYLANDSTSKPSAGARAGSVHLVVPTGAGNYEVRFFANDTFTVRAKSAAISVAAPAPPPAPPPPSPPPARTLVLTLAPVPPEFPDNTTAGSVITTATVKYSDGTSPASVTLTSSDPTFVAAKGAQLVFARALTSKDDGTHNVTITASDGLGAMVSARLFGGGNG